MVWIFLKKGKRLAYHKFIEPAPLDIRSWSDVDENKQVMTFHRIFVNLYWWNIDVQPASKMSRNVSKMSRLRHFPPTGYINLKFLWKLTWFLMFRFPKVVLLGIFPPAVAFATLAVWLTTLLIIAATPPIGWTCNSSVEALRRDPGSEIPSTAISQWAKDEIKNSENSTKESLLYYFEIINRFF